jgi:prepilin-type N-terminal cleavage/methylation domain-containing protein
MKNRFFTKQAGYTLVEVMISTAVVAIIVAAVMTEYVALLKGYETVQTYRDLHSQARFGVDVFTRDIRGASGVVSGTSNSVTFTVPTGSGTDTITYSQSGNQFLRSLSSGGSTNTIEFAEQVESVEISYFLRDNTTATNASMAFNIHAKITCSKGVAGVQKVDFIQTRTLMRNKQS